MWTKDKPSMKYRPRAWHIAPPTNRELTTPALEHGNISSLTWSEKFGLHPSNETEDELTATKPQVVEFPARVYSLLSALVAIGAALLVLTFLRN